ncbi:MAG: DUF1616 domain-containing protein [Candidatus Bathyarchaeota archaeon]|nr:MAG: DUF1616 domain-containing protein [Candidatus Bathyarchaeota archaeon]
MELKEYRRFFGTASLTLMLLVASPVLSMVISIPVGREFFSEFWLLGPDHRAEGYPFNVELNVTQEPVYVAVCNNLGYTVYYRVYMKLRNQTQPGANRTMPSSLEPLYEFRFLLSDRELWETACVFSFQGESALVSEVLINGDASPVNCSSAWDSEQRGFYYQLFFELWLYNGTTRSFEYHDRSVWLWLNMTSL